MAPAGMCRWMSVFSRKFSSRPSQRARLRMKDSAACADSFMTSPSCPVRTRLPLPCILVASMNRMSPPTGVQARPVATPGSAVRSATSGRNFCGPRKSGMRSMVMISFSLALSSATFTATARTTLASSRSRLRTPASRV